MTRLPQEDDGTNGSDHEGGGENGAMALLQELESYSAELGAFYWEQASESEGENTDDDCSSAADIASECLFLLEHLSVAQDNEDASASPAEQASAVEESALLRELNELGDGLQSLMKVLCPSVDTAAEDDPHDMMGVAQNPVPSPCTSPKMVALPKHLESRPATGRMRVHTALQLHKPFPLNIKMPLKPSKGDTKPKSATRELLNDAAFWRQYQSKSFHRHLQRQTQARTIQQQQQDKVNKAIEYRYRRVGKRCYPLAKNKSERQILGTASTIEKIALPAETSKRSYASQFAQQKESDSNDQPSDESGGLLCGVYLYGKRRSRGMFYLTCVSLDQLKTRIASRFSLAQPVVNLYREQIATNGPTRRERKYLHRVTRFLELRNGDLLCATTDGYEDMAILCAWMKKRQQVIHHLENPPPQTNAPPVARECAAVKKRTNKTQRDANGAGLSYKPPPPPPQEKLWDENGRLMSICHRLPLAD